MRNSGEKLHMHELHSNDGNTSQNNNDILHRNGLEYFKGTNGSSRSRQSGPAILGDPPAIDDAVGGPANAFRPNIGDPDVIHPDANDEVDLQQDRNEQGASESRGSSLSDSETDESNNSGPSTNLDNPFRVFQDVQAMYDAVTGFAEAHGLRDYLPTLLWAAYCERGELGNEPPPNVPNQELPETKRSFFQQSRSLKATVLVLGLLSGSCQGWNQSVISGTALSIINEWNLEPAGSDFWIVGVLAAVMPLAAGVLSVFTADPLQNHWLGRRGAIAFSSLINIIATIALARADSIAKIIGLRILIGMSLGAKASVISPLLSEISPVDHRGAILSTWQIGDSFGIFCGFLSWFIVDHYIPESVSGTRWRVLTLTTLIPAIPLLLSAFMVPESYIFAMKVGDYQKAAESTCSYSMSRLTGFRNLLSAHFQMETEASLLKLNAPLPPTRELRDRLHRDPPGVCHIELRTRECSGHTYHMKTRNFYIRLGDIIGIPRNARALLSCAIIMSSQALCGINAFAFFPTSLVPGGLPVDMAMKLALSFGVVNFVFGLLTPLLSDKLGRTNLVLMGLPLMAILMFLLASFFAIHEDNSARVGAIFFGILAFTAIYSFTLGPAAFSLAAESFGGSHREAGVAVSIFFNMTTLGVFLFIYPVATRGMGYSASLCILGCIDLVAWVACYLFVVDTKDRNLEQLHYSFELPTMLHCKYRIFTVSRAIWEHYFSPNDGLNNNHHWFSLIFNSEQWHFVEEFYQIGADWIEDPEASSFNALSQNWRRGRLDQNNPQEIQP